MGKHPVRPAKPLTSHSHSAIRLPKRKRGNGCDPCDKLTTGKQHKRKSVYCHDRPVKGLQQSGQNKTMAQIRNTGGHTQPRFTP